MEIVAGTKQFYVFLAKLLENILAFKPFAKTNIYLAISKIFFGEREKVILLTRILVE